MPISPRHAAYLAALASAREESFVSDALARWRADAHPSDRDWRFAQEVANGTVRMAQALDLIANQLGPVQLKRRERVLLRTALYQSCYMDRVPLYAIVDETVSIARRTNPAAARLLNALLRKLETAAITLPPVRATYPDDFVRRLISQLGDDRADAILAAGNAPPVTMVRLRSDAPLQPGLRLLDGGPLAIVNDTTLLPALANDPRYYIQNATPYLLLAHAAAHIAPPCRILDLCSSPGGKLILAHDLWPDAQLYANDVSPQKVARLRDNLTKYGINATISCRPGQEYVADAPFDLVIVDAPCSNTGVLGRRAEARWRLTPDNLDALRTTQQALLRHALTLGPSCYMTCSILQEENEQVVSDFNTPSPPLTIYPDGTGRDGGFACLIK